MEVVSFQVSCRRFSDLWTGGLWTKSGSLLQLQNVVVIVSSDDEFRSDASGLREMNVSISVRMILGVHGLANARRCVSECLKHRLVDGILTHDVAADPALVLLFQSTEPGDSADFRLIHPVRVLSEPREQHALGLIRIRVL